MSYYYKYNFVSPEPIFSTIKEELKSYFDSGSVDDLMFPTYLDKCLQKLGRTSYAIQEETLFIEDFQSRLPDNFHAVREAWMCSEIPLRPYKTANSFYSQSATNIVQISPLSIGGTCSNPTCTSPDCVGCGECSTEITQAVYKTNQEIERRFRREYLLQPGNISAKSHCDVNYTDAWDFSPSPRLGTNFTPYSSSMDSFDIRDNKFVTNFRNGIVNMIFYSTEYDNSGIQLIPDNYRIKEYVEAFIKYKVFETLSNQINDETYKQLESKMNFYLQASNEAYIMAELEIKKQTAWQKQRRIKKDLNRNNMYKIPSGVNRYGWRRNT